MNASETVRRHLAGIPADRRAFAEDYVAHAEESGPYVGPFGETNLIIDAQIFAQIFADYRAQLDGREAAHPQGDPK